MDAVDPNECVMVMSSDHISRPNLAAEKIAKFSCALDLAITMPPRRLQLSHSIASEMMLPTIGRTEDR